MGIGVLPVVLEAGFGPYAFRMAAATVGSSARSPLVPHRRASKVEKCGRVDSGNDEDVLTGRREDIEEGHGPWALKNDLGRDATGEDLAEDAVGHAGSVAQVRRR